MPKKDFMVRPAGMFNGSVIAALVDVSSGYAAASAKPIDSYFTTVIENESSESRYGKTIDSKSTGNQKWQNAHNSPFRYL